MIGMFGLKEKFPRFSQQVLLSGYGGYGFLKVYIVIKVLVRKVVE